MFVRNKLFLFRRKNVYTLQRLHISTFMFNHMFESIRNLKLQQEQDEVTSTPKKYFKCDKEQLI